MHFSASQAAGFCLLTALAWAVPASHRAAAQDVAPRPLAGTIIEDPGPLPAPLASFEGGLIQAGHCASCGTGVLGGGLGRLGGGGLPAADPLDPVGCPGPHCVPGRLNSHCPEHEGFMSRLLTGLYECLMVPDPCYEPGWRPIMDVGLFTECARPVSQQRIRMGSQQHMTNYTRNSFRMAPFPIGPIPGNPLYYVNSYANTYEASLYTEISAGNVAATFDVPFVLTTFSDNGSGGSGFGNMVVGTKSTIFDSEFLQVGMSFKSSLAVGLPISGLGNGLTSIEPGVLVGMKISEDMFLQLNFNEWIPFGGVPPYPGAMLIVSGSLNRKLWQANPAVPLFGAIEYAGYYFQSGGYMPYQTIASTTNIPFVSSSGNAYQQMGPSLRLFMTEKLDMACGAMFALNPGQGSWGDQQYRLEFRFRY
ncbi:MAG: hypothetical protein ACKO26_13705 [Planctomycetota bacterium]